MISKCCTSLPRAAVCSNLFLHAYQMARIHTHYDNLKVARNAPPEVIRAAYRTLSKKYHPDHHPDNPDAIRIIQLINTAYDVLSDPVRRQEHDRWIEKEEALQQQAGKSSGTHRSSRSTAPSASSGKHHTYKASHGYAGNGVMQRMRMSVGQFFKGLRKA